MEPVNLQAVVNRYKQILQTADWLIQCHPRQQGNPGKAAALAPASVLASVAAFEAFAEELLAATATHRGYGYGQIAKLISMNNPTVKTLDDKLTHVLGTGADQSWRKTFSLTVWRAPDPGQGETFWFDDKTMDWAGVVGAAEGWVQVRHCITHGLVRGTRAEYWPGPLKGDVAASSVLRHYPSGKCALSIQGAETCGRVYREAAHALTQHAATVLKLKQPRWSAVPTFRY